MRTIYLDYCTSTPVAASVRECMLPFLNEFYGHPTSSHWFGRASQEAIEDARSNVASLLGCHPSEIIFTSGGTESANLGLLGVAKAVTKNIGNLTPHLIISKLEHPCVRQCAAHLEKLGWKVTRIGCDRTGVVCLDQLDAAIDDSTRIVSVIHGSHRIGTLQPIDKISEICHERDILLHTDAAQTVGKVDCDVDHLGVDLLSLSGHKIYAPKGIGVLYVRTGIPIETILFGEGCEAAIRPGTANVPHIVGLGQAAKLAKAGLESSSDLTSQYRDRFHHQLEYMIGKPIVIHGLKAERLPGLLSIELPGVPADRIQQMLPEICFAPSAFYGGHCARNGKTLNPTHAALGLSQESSANTLRVSFGWTTNEEDLQQAVQMIATAYESLIG